jgi:predicted DsbA family dithiol-disulfide isomerase
VTWLPFLLHPEYPPEGQPREQLLRRYGPGMEERMRRLFADAGLAYAPHPEVIPNTTLAHRVSELGRDRGLHERVHDRLMDAYWTESRDIGDARELRVLAAEAGLDDIDEALDADAYDARVRASTEQAYEIGITGVPGFLLDSRLLVLGAQPREVFERAFARLDTSGGD